jgi:hypothetical protein
VVFTLVRAAFEGKDQGSFFRCQTAPCFRRQRLAREATMAAKEISVKKYVVRLNGEERERLETLIRKGKSPARRVLKARILLKADVSAGKGWSDNRIIEALETSPSDI